MGRRLSALLSCAVMAHNSRLVAVFDALSSSAMKAARFRPGGIGSRNSRMMVPGLLKKPVQ